ncbi:MAG: PIN domain-containing protein [Rhodocyclaceae bacterium]|nr:PIN domain-containing protein [Rhodocyclaceae bacterium]
MWSPDSIAGKSVYLDANVLIYAFESTLPPFGRLSPLVDVFKSFEAEKSWARTSLLTRAEVLVHPLRHKNEALLNLYSTLLAGNTFIAIDAISAAIVNRAAKLRADGGLRLADAVHLASALESGCDGFLTADKRLLAYGSQQIDVFPLDELTKS